MYLKECYTCALHILSGAGEGEVAGKEVGGGMGVMSPSFIPHMTSPTCGEGVQVFNT
jgi:hypothetical protein